MGRFPAEPLEIKLEWMRERQRKRAAQEALRVEPGRVVLLPVDPPVPRPELPRMLRVADVATLLGVSRFTVRRVFRKKAVKLGACVLIPEQAVRDELKRLTGS